MTFDPYDLLGLLPNATPDDIRAAYRRRAAEWHPDHHPPDKKAEAVERMVQLNAARDLLLDTRRRIQYHREHEEALRWKMDAAQTRQQAEQAAASAFAAYEASKPRARSSAFMYEINRRRQRQAFYRWMAFSLIGIGGVFLLLLAFLGSDPTVKTQLGMMAAAAQVWLSLTGSVAGILVFSIVIAVFLTGLAQFLRH